MSEQRDAVVKRVMHALEDERDPESLVHAYFERERDVVLQAARQTLEATDEPTDAEHLAEVVDRELIEGLRFPTRPPGGLPARLYVHRRRIAAVVSTLAVVVLGMLLLL